MKVTEINEGGFKDRLIRQQDNHGSKMLWDYKVSNSSSDAKGINFQELKGKMEASSEKEAKSKSIRRYTQMYRGKVTQATSTIQPPVNKMINDFNKSGTLSVVVVLSKV